jgi:hypothetical protein
MLVRFHVQTIPPPATGDAEAVMVVAPLRQLQLAAQATQLRFETAPGAQSQIDWGQALMAGECRRL